MTDVLSVCMRPYRRTLGSFEDILALDATLLRLWDALTVKFPSTTDSKAAAKLHVVMSLASISPNRVKLRTGREHDTAAWKIDGLLSQ